MIANNYTKKIPEYLFYSHTLDKEMRIESHRMLGTKTGEYLGEMITLPQDFCFFSLAMPRTHSLYIEYFRTFKHNKGFGTKFLNFARAVSKQKGCKGRLHLISADCFDNYNPPHIFYRKYGFDSRETKKLKEIDMAILHPNNKFTFNNIGMFFPPKPRKKGGLLQSKSLLEKLKILFFNKILDF